MGKNITIEESTEFTKKAIDMIVELGATESDRDFYKHDLNTIAGNLKIQVDSKHKHCFSVFTKFDNVELAKDKVAFVNPYSGKYNFHPSGSVEIDEAVQYIKDQLEFILPN